MLSHKSYGNYFDTFGSLTGRKRRARMDGNNDVIKIYNNALKKLTNYFLEHGDHGYNAIKLKIQLLESKIKKEKDKKMKKEYNKQLKQYRKDLEDPDIEIDDIESDED
mgnify:CR=1 FL=1